MRADVQYAKFYGRSGRPMGEGLSSCCRPRTPAKPICVWQTCNVCPIWPPSDLFGFTVSFLHHRTCRANHRAVNRAGCTTPILSMGSVLCHSSLCSFPQSQNRPTATEQSTRERNWGVNLRTAHAACPCKTRWIGTSCSNLQLASLLDFLITHSVVHITPFTKETLYSSLCSVQLIDHHPAPTILLLMTSLRTRLT
jgi:hypothetical protein